MRSKWSVRSISILMEDSNGKWKNDGEKITMKTAHTHTRKHAYNREKKQAAACAFSIQRKEDEKEK